MLGPPRREPLAIPGADRQSGEEKRSDKAHPKLLIAGAGGRLDERAVPYAILLGGETTEGTFEYVGDGSEAVFGRPFVIAAEESNRTSVSIKNDSPLTITNFDNVSGVLIKRGVGTLISSLASLITFREYSKRNPGHVWSYLGLFTLLNFGFLIILTAVEWIF